MAEITAAEAYDRWFDNNKPLFDSEAQAIEAQLPETWTEGVEIGCGTGKFSERLGISRGVEPSEPMAQLAEDRGISVEQGTAEDLPLPADAVDLAALLGVVGYVADLADVFSELARVVSPGGHAVVAFLQADGAFADLYDTAANNGGYPDTLEWGDPYPLEMAKKATWRDVETVLSGLRAVGFTDMTTTQTLTQPIAEAIHTTEAPSTGHDEGSWIVVRAVRE
ncbi:MAG: methylase involved in ubiquinone/menaquinone biosynthesis [Halonotius sp. J07HN4]|nr:MAG: methylase involved in ubiquinone/menaquinone biosynthesis [Halonotius sp. J07HN4]